MIGRFIPIILSILVVDSFCCPRNGSVDAVGVFQVNLLLGDLRDFIGFMDGPFNN